MTHHITPPMAWWLFAAMLALTACGDVDSIDATACTPGTLDCLCAEDDVCDTHDGEAMRCVEGRCALPECTRGTVDCGCRDDGTCSAWSPAGALICVDGMCLVDDCPAGTDGCPCTANTRCAAGLACAMEDSTPTCRPRAVCPPGRQGCPCHLDESCDAGEPGGPDLVCDGGYCVPDACARGERDCGCLPGGRCVDGSVCEGLFCVEDTGQTLAPPANPKCFTPCRDHIRGAGGEIERVCDDEGVMDGCVGRTVCIDGSCVGATPGRPKAAEGCVGDSQCSPLQACIQAPGDAIGRCYSDCEGDADCNGSRVCHARVCRLPCSSDDAAACGDAAYCRLGPDGVNGHCFPLADGGLEVGTAAANVGAPSYRLQRVDLDPPTDPASSPPLEFTDAVRCHGLIIENTSPGPIALRLRRADHRVSTPAGAIEVDAGDADGPALGWLGISSDGCPEGPTLPADDPEWVLAPGVTATVHVGHVPDADADLWSGRLVLEARFEPGGHPFPRHVDVSYARGPLGRWVGDVWLFADFDTEHLDAWLQAGRPGQPFDVLDDDGAVAISGAWPRNALLLRWIALRDGRLGFDEFLSAVRALREGTWALPAVRALCPDGAVCYLADNAIGYGQFSDDEDAIRLPTAAARAPLTVELARTTEQDGERMFAAGRIVTAAALQYPGDPRVELELDPATTLDGRLARPIAALTADIAVGGRLTDPEGDCPAGFVADPTPWLVPGFDVGSTAGQQPGARERVACVDARTPLGPDAEDANRSLSRANPLPEGQAIYRQLEVIDGALIDERVLFALVRETISTPLAMTGGRPLVAYGYALLEREPGADAPREGVPLDVDALPAPAGESGVTCDPDLVAGLLGAVGDVADASPAVLDRLAVAVVDGTVPVDPGTLTPIDPTDEVAHALCVHTDTFDGGPDAVPCPADSPVVFFTLPTGGPAPADDDCHGAQPRCVAADDCPHCLPSEACEACDDGLVCLAQTCAARLQAWADDPEAGVRLNPSTTFDGGGQTVVPGVEGRCAARDGDLIACHDVFAEPGSEPIVDAFSGERIGYICHATGYIRDPDAQPASPGERDPLADPHYCPPGSEVTFFAWRPDGPEDAVTDLRCHTDTDGICNDGEPCARYVCHGLDADDPDLDPSDLADGDADCNRRCEVGQACPSKGACADWLANQRAELDILDTEIAWRCIDPLRGTCSDDRYDLTVGKRFFRPDARLDVNQQAPPLDDAIEAAFRYETRFRDRAGTSLGFTPGVCDASSTAQSYCYDPDEVAAIGQRVDCAVYLYTTHYDALHLLSRQMLQAVLTRTFALREEHGPGLAHPITHDGFERARAKLLVMLGDEAMTQALSSRFDQAGIRQAIFRGQDFEADGIELQGVAGFEMYSLHLAAQYYALALERFFALGEAIDASLRTLPDGAGFITQGTAVAWFERLLRASTRKAAAQAEIAERYRVMAAPALGRAVVERASAAIHLESVLFSRVIQDLVDVSEAASAPQIRRALQRAQTGWGAAMRQLASTYALLDDTPRFLGIPQGFVPFPPLDAHTLDVNAFEKLLASARRKVAIAADKEERAIADARAFDTSAAEFRSTLAALRADYEQRIGDICGTFEGEDGAIYAATARNAHHHPRARSPWLGDPCGRMGTGAIASKLATAEVFRLKVEEARQQQANLYGTMDGLNETLQMQCARIGELQDVTWEARTGTISLRQSMGALDIAIDATDRSVSIAEALADGSKCVPPIAGTSNSPGNCIQVLGAKLTVTKVKAAALAAVTAARTAKLAMSIGADRIEQELERYTILDECRALQIDTYGQITGLFAELPVLANKLEQQMVQLDRTAGEIESLYDKAQALQAAYAEAEDLAIDVEAARNDPNVRIYRSDAVLAADRTFGGALEEVYEATLVFEYYTGQSYAERDRLRFMRLARYGEDNLERYLAELADAFDDFEQVYGNPDLRATIVSLKDVLAPAIIEPDGVPRTEQQRVDTFRAALVQAGITDPRGRHRVDFRLAFDRVSPLTFGHKVRAVEAELVGVTGGGAGGADGARPADLGDALARVYLTPAGTATVRGIDEDRQLRLPPRTAVLDAFVNGDRAGRLDPAIYRSERLRDQPLINTGWQVVFDRRAEQVNADVSLEALTDIRFYIYYTDFTEAP